MNEYPCQQLLGGSGAAIYSNEDGLCDHPECNPQNNNNETHTLNACLARAIGKRGANKTPTQEVIRALIDLRISGNISLIVQSGAFLVDAWFGLVPKITSDMGWSILRIGSSMLIGLLTLWLMGLYLRAWC